MDKARTYAAPRNSQGGISFEKVASRRGGAVLRRGRRRGAIPPLRSRVVLRPHLLRPPFEYFRRKHRVVAVDLRGHGQSDKPHQSYTMAAFTDDLAWMCDQLGIEKPVVIVHSMGGIVAFDLACRYPTLPSAIVMLYAAVVLPAGAAPPHRT